MESPPPIKTCKNNEKGDVDADGNDGGERKVDGKDVEDDEGDVKDCDGGDAVLDTKSVFDPDINVVKPGEADVKPEEADKGVRNTISGKVEKGVGNDALANILVDVLANPFGDLDTSAIPAVADIPVEPYTNLAIPAVVDTPVKPYTDPDTIFEEWSLCTSYFPSVVLAELWRKQICDCRDGGFLDGMYMLSCVKYMSLIVCHRHFYLLALKLYLVDALPAELHSRIDLIWDH